MNRRIFYIIPSLAYGGAEVLAIQQLEWLRNKNWEVFLAILSNQNQDALIESLNLPEDHLVLIDYNNANLNFSSVRFAIKNYWRLIKAICENKIDVVVAHLPIAHFWGRLLKLKLPSLRLVIYHHSTQYNANPLNSLNKLLFNKVSKLLASKTDDLTICISEAVKQNIEKHFILKNPVVLYNAVNDKLSDIQSYVQPVIGKKADCISLILPGRLHAAKGQLFFLKIFLALVKERALGKYLQLTIAGGGSLEPEIREFIKENGLYECVHLTGTLQNESLLRRMYVADFIIIPSLHEGLGIVAIEALMLGKTVIASDADGLKEVIKNGQNGYMFKAGNEMDCLKTCESVFLNFPASLLPADVLRNDYKQRFFFDSHMTIFSELLLTCNKDQT